MKRSISEQIREANALLIELHSRVREALSGRQDFNLEFIQAISLPIERMAPIVYRANELRESTSDVTSDLKQYSDTLSALQNTLEKVRFMLLARKTSIQASQSHIETVNLWATTLNQTR